MFALIRKDLIACRLFLLFGLAIYALYAVSAYHQPLGYFVVNIGAIILFALAPIVVDDKYRIETLVCYLPPSRRQTVFARYAMALLALICGLSLQYGLGAALSVVWSEKTGFWTLCSPQAALVFCVLPIAFVSFYLPCYFRFGLGRGSFVFVVLTAVLVIFTTSPFLVTGVLSANGGFVLTHEMVQHPELAMFALVDHFAVSAGEGSFYGMLSIGSIALVAASLAFSIRFFDRRDF